MLDTLDDLRKEFLARGFNHLDQAPLTTRADQYLNQAYLELCEEEPWPFVQGAAFGDPGAGSVSILDLRSVQSVYDMDAGRALPYAERRQIVADYGDATRAGSPSYWYFQGSLAINTYPVGGTLEVWYWRVPAELVSPTDVPVVPKRFRNLIVDGAVRRALIDGNEFQAAAAVEGERQAGLGRMRDSMLWRNNAVPEYVIAAEGTDW